MTTKELVLSILNRHGLEDRPAAFIGRPDPPNFAFACVNEQHCLLVVGGDDDLDSCQRVGQPNTPAPLMPANPHGHTWDAAGRFCLLCGAPMDDCHLGQPCDAQEDDHWTYGWVA